MEISKEVLALWGAGLSTALALVKMWELWSSRSRVEVSYAFSGGPDGNDIIIRNLSDKPMIPEGVKTEKSDRTVTGKYAELHLNIGIEAMTEIGEKGEQIKHFTY